MAHTDTTVDYRALHWCRFCDRNHRLDVLPVEGGWVAGVRCSCREPNGRPRRYSTESIVFGSFEDAYHQTRLLRRGEAVFA